MEMQIVCLKRANKRNNFKWSFKIFHVFCFWFGIRHAEYCLPQPAHGRNNKSGLDIIRGSKFLYLLSQLLARMETKGVHFHSFLYMVRYLFPVVSYPRRE